MIGFRKNQKNTNQKKWELEYSDEEAPKQLENMEIPPDDEPAKEDEPESNKKK